MFRKGIFISYSHEDQKWLEVIQTFLKPLTRGEKISVWSDREILPGANWEQEITGKLQTCRIVLLLVTPHFLASDFITNKEMPLILKMLEQGEIMVYWIAVSHSSYQLTELKDIQAANDPGKPLDSLDKSDRDKTLVHLAEIIANAMDINAITNMFRIIDDFVPGQQAFIDNVEPDPAAPHNFSLQAYQEKDKVEIRTRDKYVVETISAADLEKLDRDSKILIRSYEATMKILFERWTELQPKSFSQDPVIRSETRDEMAIIRKDLCAQLNGILDYLKLMHKNLDDHYHHVRHICLQ